MTITDRVAVNPRVMWRMRAAHRSLVVCALVLLSLVVVVTVSGKAAPVAGPVNGIALYVIDGATGAECGSECVGQTQVQFAMCFVGSPTIVFSNLSFGYTARRNGNVISQVTLPPAGITYVSSVYTCSSGPGGSKQYLQAWDLRDLDSGTTYEIEGWARDSGTTYTSNLVVTTPTQPGPFTLTSATAGCGGDSPQIVLNWTAAAGVATYEVVRDGGLYVTGLPADTLSFTDSGSSVTAGVTYTYFIRARNASALRHSGSLSATASNTCGIPPTPPLSITTTTLVPATATVGQGYAAQQPVAAAGGRTPYSWSVSGQPGGMAIDSSSGAIVGTPTVAGTFNLTATVLDSSSPQLTASKVLTLTVVNACAVITLLPSTLGVGTVGTAYNQGISQTGSVGTTTYDISAGSLPSGLTLSSAGVVEGIPTASGTFSFTLRATDTRGCSGSRVYTLTISPATIPISGIRISDALPQLASTSGGVICDPSTIGSMSLIDRKGTIADGVSALVLRVTAAVPLTFTLPNSADGTLGACGGGSATAIQPVNGVVAAIYTPPDNFTLEASGSGHAGCVGLVPSDPIYATQRKTLGCRSIRVAATSADGASSTATNLWLNRVPVVLLHGFSSSRSMWEEGGWLDTLKGKGFVTASADYQQSNLESMQTATVVLQSTILSVLKHLKNDGIAAAQADVVGHSMGGLIARELSLSDARFKAPGNANRGMIHRLVSIGTPHLGTPVAAMIASVRDGGTAFFLRGLLEAFSASLGIPFGAVDDMIPGSPAMTRLESSALPTHAIAGITTVSNATGNWISKLYNTLSLGRFIAADAIFGEANDLVVGESSQRGGRISTATAGVVANVIHSSALNPPFGNEIGETESPEVRNYVIRALSASSNAFQQIVPDRSSGLAARSMQTPRPALVTTTSSVQLHITSPVAGTQVTPGATLTIQMQSSAPVALRNMLIIVGGVLTIDAPAVLPSTVSVSLPSSLPMGALTIGVVASDTTGALLGDITTIVASPAMTPTMIAVTPPTLDLDAGSPAQQLLVLASFGDTASATRADVTRVTTFGSGDSRIARVSGTGLVTAVGQGTTTIQVSQGGLTASVPITVGALPTLKVSTPALAFAATAASTAWVDTTAPQTIQLDQTAGPSLAWSATTDAAWLQVSPASGAGPARLTIRVVGTPQTVPASTTGTIVVTAAGAANSPMTLPVTLRVIPIEQTSMPVGAFDTPVEGSTGVSGSVAVTGWALDDVEVTEVQIWRDPNSADPPGAIFAGQPPQGGRVFVGYASFVEGARPDVQTANPTIPLNSRAGWGYLMLTRGLVWDGGGPFKLYAIAKDREGHLTEIGSKIISVDNAPATKPFGAIDTPGQGATATGMYPNTGWVLTPNAGATIPAANVQVAIDGVFLSAVPSVSDRADITAGFPLFTTTGAGRGLFVDTTQFANGPHTIGWLVTDSAGKADGVGSRVFTIANGASVLGLASGSMLSADVDALPLATGPVSGRRGFDRRQPLETLQHTGARTSTGAEELDRIELRLDVDGAGDYAGYQRVGSRLTPLPIGSHIEGSTFTWQLAAGFLGSFDLVFVRYNGGQPIARRDVRVTIYPQGTLTRPQVVIDTPSPEQAPGGAFKLTGWAVDPASRSGTGISFVSVWAYPLRGSRPVFVGRGDTRGRRPDVGAVYGVNFQDSGFEFRTSGLARGAYDLAVFAWSESEGTFLPARVVRVTVR
jgi:pimeloyl-ACP methyl ester carboxylesterase